MIVELDSFPAPALHEQFGGSHRFTVAEYHTLGEHGILTTDNKVELLDGYILYKLDHVVLPPPSPYFPQWQQLRRWTLDEYHRMTQLGVLTSEDKIELLDGYLVQKMPQNDPHHSTIQRLTLDLVRTIPVGWQPRIQLPIDILGQEPEPDAAVVRGDRRTFDNRKPTNADFGIVVEVADTSLRIDRSLKAELYARAGIPIYWIVNIVDSHIEVYTQPNGPVDAPAYAHRQDYKAGDSLPLILDGHQVVLLPVAEVLP